jgi:Mlc titration factor MtfA (ptsG expression regulator)
MVEEEYIPVLISGAAVQITFGLPSYRMDYYQTIHVIRKEYTLHIDKETYYGHVSRSGIYISWKRFLEGYENYNDADNIGLHEMAHALSFDSLLGNEDDADRLFKERIRPFYKEGTVLFRRMKKGYSTILEDYAASNFDEFWAVSVEHFFENGASLRSNHPDLYNSIAFLLNQDPLSSELIRDPVLAGLAN